MNEVTVLKNQPVLEIALSGEIDSGNADEFFEETMGAYRISPADIVFQCAALKFIDSTTLGTFVKIHNLLKAEGHTVRLTGLMPRLKKLFTICALDTIMEIA